MTRVISTTVNNIKTFHITAENALPDKYGDRANRRIGSHAELKNRISFIQEFEFTGSSRQVHISRDCLTVAVSGEYPPQIKIFDLPDLSQTTVFSVRRSPAHFEFLTDDWSKLGALRGDRKFDLYTKGGIFASISLPIRCRNFVYNPPTADVIMSSEDSQLLRLNLELGQFVQSIPACAQNGNCVAVSDVHQLIVCGFDDGQLEFYDPRDKRSLAAVDLGSEVTQVAFNKSGYKVAAGLSTGDVLLFDIRSATPRLRYSHRNDTPINSLAFQNNDKYLLSSDSRGVRIYSLENEGKFYTSFETKSQLNHMIPFPDSGLIFAATDAQKVQTMFIPELGPAPRFASFLENLINDVEAEEQDGTPLYENMKFVTRDELEKYGGGHLVGSSALKPYMHGFFVHRELYKMIVSQNEGTELEDHLKRTRMEKKEEAEKAKIVAQRKAPKKDLGDLEVTENDSKRKAKKKMQMVNDPYYLD
ncbi:nucleolar protein 10-like [Tritrichomonas foetus]|uniref:Nucleolar protein 10-like n=1 Tax=Tritrichomonas foetus TaxID=1144522 RepID=A0A1J4KGU2_9EUKA|nr:nucleolar protein 10-like [Tritrichomonas foetus]|eukprot:OHT09020.1 nucleolar protein 10-like [Tritrichomonas foetus]